MERRAEKSLADPETPVSVLTRLQQGIESLYRVRTDLDVEAFMIGATERDEAGVGRVAREQLLIREAEDQIELGLFVDPGALKNLAAHDPAAGLHDGNFSDFCLAVEGVSHFVYVAICAGAQRSVCALELELQAEVDKFACCVMLDPEPANASGWRHRLYDDVGYADDLDAVERDRYRAANDDARRFAGWLGRRFVSERRIEAMLPELRHFYRLDLSGKRDRIARLA